MLQKAEFKLDDWTACAGLVSVDTVAFLEIFQADTYFRS